MVLGQISSAKPATLYCWTNPCLPNLVMDVLGAPDDVKMLRWRGFHAVVEDRRPKAVLTVERTAD